MLPNKARMLQAVMVVCLFSPAALGRQEGRVLYSNDFDAGQAGGEWSVAATDTTPSGRGFLGRFCNDAKLRLTLGRGSPVSPEGLGEHKSVTIELDLFIIHSWDGTKFGDQWSLSVEDGPTLLRTSFANPLKGTADNPQSFPATFGKATFPARTGAAEVNTLGYWNVRPRRFGDSVYRLRYTFPHSADSLVFRFAAAGFTGRPLHGLGDESWGMDNVRVSVSNEPAPGVVGMYTASLPLVAPTVKPEPVTRIHFPSAGMLCRFTTAIPEAWAVVDENLVGCDIGPGNAPLLTYRTHFKKISKVVVEGMVLPAAMTEVKAPGLFSRRRSTNFRLSVGPINLIFNWEIRNENHYRNGEVYTLQSGHALVPGKWHAIAVEQIGKDAVVSVDGRRVYTTQATLAGTVTIYPAHGSTIRVSEIDITGVPDPGRHVSGHSHSNTY